MLYASMLLAVISLGFISWHPFAIATVAVLLLVLLPIELLQQRSTGSVLSFKQQSWWLAPKAGQSAEPIQIRANTLITPWLVAIAYRKPQQRLTRWLIIPRDATDLDSHRRLRVYLRFARYALSH